METSCAAMALGVMGETGGRGTAAGGEGGCESRISLRFGETWRSR